VLGHGSGGHPLIVLLEPFKAVLYYLEEYAETMSNSHGFNDKDCFYERIQEMSDPLIRKPSFIYSGWTIEHYHQFFEDCKTVVHPFNKVENYRTFDNWLTVCFGEFVYWEYPEFWQNTELTEINDSLVKQWNLYPMWLNILPSYSYVKNRLTL